MKSIISSNIFKRFIMIFLCVVIPFLSITLFSNWRAERSTRNEITKSIVQKSDYYTQALEAEYTRVIGQQQSLVLDYDLFDLAYRNNLMNKFSWTTSINRLQEKLSVIKSTNAYVHVISVYMPQMMSIISSPGGGRYIYDYLTETDMLKLEAALNYSDGAYIIDNQIAVSTVKKRGDTVYYVIETVLSGDKLLNDFMQLVNDAGCFIYNDNGIVIEPHDTAYAHNLVPIISRRDGEESVEVDGRRYIVVKHRLSFADLTFVSYYDESAINASMYGYNLLLWCSIILFFGMTCFYVIMTHMYINQPVLVLLDHFERLKNGDLNSRIAGTHHDEFAIVFERFNQMVDRLNSVILQSYKQTIYLQRAELKQLQAQINPHFLYNTYFLLHRLIKRNDPLAIEFSGFLGEYFKYITKNSEHMVPFEKEDAHARNYAYIQALRFEDRIRVEFDNVPQEMKSLLVPQLILQPIFENAYLHGLENLDGDGLLKVSYGVDDYAYHIFVLNNGGHIEAETICGLKSMLTAENADAPDLKETTGLMNIHRRLQLEFGRDSGLKIMTQGNLFTVEMIITKEDTCAKATDS